MKHLFLVSYVLGCASSFLLAALLRSLGRRLRSPLHGSLSAVFACAGLFMAFWYVGEYLVLNVQHRDSLPYAGLEAAAVLAAGAAAFFLLRAARGPRPGTGTGPRAADLLVLLCALGTASLKFSQFLFGRHVPALYWVKLGLLALLLVPVAVSSIRLVRTGWSGGPDPSRGLGALLGAAALLLPAAGAVDVLVIKSRFYEGAEPLGMHFPLAVSAYLAFCLAMILLVQRRLHRMQVPEDRLQVFVGTYRITMREREVMELVLAGKSNREIAKALYISVATTKNHIHSIFEKARLSSRSELITLILGE
jgi:DNA-binding CsgD family transcriptional regulator